MKTSVDHLRSCSCSWSLGSGWWGGYNIFGRMYFQSHASPVTPLHPPSTIKIYIHTSPPDHPPPSFFYDHAWFSSSPRHSLPNIFQNLSSNSGAWMKWWVLWIGVIWFWQLISFEANANGNSWWNNMSFSASKELLVVVFVSCQVSFMRVLA